MKKQNNRFIGKFGLDSLLGLVLVSSVLMFTLKSYNNLTSFDSGTPISKALPDLFGVIVGMPLICYSPNICYSLCNYLSQKRCNKLNYQNNNLNQ